MSVVPMPPTDLYNFENCIKGSMIYSSVDSFIISNEGFNKCDNSIVYLLNWQCGFGSALTVFIQNSYYLHSINPKAHILPMFCNNTSNFKYSESSLNNTFFRYFKYNNFNDNINFSDYTVYFIQSSPTCSIPFFSASLPPMLVSPSNTYISYFREYFKLCIGEHIIKYIENIKESKIPLIGIHVRSMAQKRAHCQSYLSISLRERLSTVKHSLDHIYEKYNVFIASDVNLYIDCAKDIFGNIYYINDVSRINNEEDSIPQLLECGFKLGSDILYDCLALSLCDAVYVSNSNIPFIICTLNPDANLIEY